MTAQKPKSGTSTALAANLKSKSSSTSKAKWQDFLFHKLTFSFAFLVMAVLVGILLSLLIGAWPAIVKFGPGFITRVEWDPVNNE